MNQTNKPQEREKKNAVIYEGASVVFTPLDPKSKHPELVVVNLCDLIEASNRHRKELSLAISQTKEEILEWAEKDRKDKMFQAISLECIRKYLSKK